MSDHLFRRKQVTPEFSHKITSETSQIIEEAISKIHDLFLVSDPRNGRRDIAAFIRWYIDVMYFHLPPDDESRWPKNAGSEDATKSVSQLAETMEAILSGEIDPVQLRKAAEVASAAVGMSPAIKTAFDKHTVALLYKQYRDKYGISKAEFVRRVIKLNELTVPKAQRKGINSTNFKNVYRELGRLLEKDGAKAD
jgi:hypothetical protein